MTSPAYSYDIALLSYSVHILLWTTVVL